MGGWRDGEGRTAPERQKQNFAAARARFVETVKRRPLSRVKPALSIAFALLIAIALLLALR